MSSIKKSKPDNAKISTTIGDEIIDQVPIIGWSFFNFNFNEFSVIINEGIVSG